MSHSYFLAIQAALAASFSAFFLSHSALAFAFYSHFFSAISFFVNFFFFGLELDVRVEEDFLKCDWVAVFSELEDGFLFSDVDDDRGVLSL